MTPALLGMLGLLLAGPAPWLLRRVPAWRRTPAAALLLWQAVALAAVLAALGAGLSLITLLLSRGAPGGLQSTPWGHLGAAAVAALTLTVGGRLMLSGHRVGTELRGMRRWHRDQVDLVSSRFQDGVQVLAHPLPVAWCLPGMRQHRIVVSQGLVASLEPEQIDAVVAHERAHLRSRHDLVLEAFTVLHRAFPRWAASGAALREAELLVELLADHAAVRQVGARTLAESLLAVSTSHSPAGSLGAAGEPSDLLVRVRLLADQGSHGIQAGALVALAVLLLALPTLTVVEPWLIGLA